MVWFVSSIDSISLEVKKHVRWWRTDAVRVWVVVWWDVAWGAVQAWAVVVHSKTNKMIFFPTCMFIGWDFFICLFKSSDYVHLGIIWKFFSTVVSSVVLVTVVVTIVVIVMDNRKPYKTLAWVLVLVFLPVVLSFIIFLVKIHGKKGWLARRVLSDWPNTPWWNFRCRSLLKRLKSSWYQLIRFFKRLIWRCLWRELDESSSGWSAPHAARVARNHSISPLSYSHGVLYFWDDAVGRLVKDALMDKAREGGSPCALRWCGLLESS